MELRKSVRGVHAKRFIDESDEEEQITTKKNKLNTGKGHNMDGEYDFENYGFGKRVKRKNALFKNYKLDSESDSDFDFRGVKVKRSKSGKKFNPRNLDCTKLELLLNWKRDLQVGDPAVDEKSYKVFKCKNIVESDLKSYGSDLQALFINIKWRVGSSTDGVKIDDFKKLDLNKKLMKNGIIFVWSEKEILGRLLKIMEEKGFFYIENLAIAMMDANLAVQHQNGIKSQFREISKETKDLKSKNINSPLQSETSTTDSIKNSKHSDITNEEFLETLEIYKSVEASDILFQGESPYLRKSKKVLMMFRRNDSKESNLELRHQRTCDALFDLVNQEDPRASDAKTIDYIYRMIETLLPRALYDPQTPKSSLKMMELWGNSGRRREGWISICEE